MSSFSVVIPAFNQGRYLPRSIASALAQTLPAADIIVVNDGSTDETAEVLAEFRQRIVVIDQCNQGLAWARNVGVHQSKGTYIAFLDADDVWLPSHLATMNDVLTRHPQASVVHGAVMCIDEAGMPLHQGAGARAFSLGNPYSTLLRANSLLPSTAVISREAFDRSGGFDPAIPGVEDWDLWLRLARTGAIFVAIPEIVAHYRLHPASLSVNSSAMQRSARIMVERLFGQEANRSEGWSIEARRAWSGHYRYCALTSVLRDGDWTACARSLARALVIDPSLVDDGDLFYELALGTQPLGWRGTPEYLELAANALEVGRMLQNMFAAPADDRLLPLRAAAHHAAFVALSQVAWQIGDRRLTRAYLRTAAGHDPAALIRPAWWRGHLRTLVPDALLSARRARHASRS